MLASDNGVFSCAISKLLDRDSILFHQRAGQVGSAAEELLLAPLQSASSLDIDPAGNLTLGRQLLEGNSIQTADLLTFDQLANNSTKCLLKCPWMKSIPPIHSSAFTYTQVRKYLRTCSSLEKTHAHTHTQCHLFALSSHREKHDNLTIIFYNYDSSEPFDWISVHPVCIIIFSLHTIDFFLLLSFVILSQVAQREFTNKPNWFRALSWCGLADFQYGLHPYSLAKRHKNPSFNFVVLNEGKLKCDQSQNLPFIERIYLFF